jgi:hypothetical protein
VDEPNVRLGEFVYPLVRHKLRVWLVLEEHYTDLIQAAGKGDREKFCTSLYAYISAAFGYIEKELPWYELIRAFTSDHNHNRPSFDFPVLHTFKEKKKDTENGWEYTGRTWFMWLHQLAKEYNWDVEYIANLDLDYAIALLQETLVDAQLKKEWEWGLSPNCFSFEQSTQKSKFMPLDRPAWMLGVPKPIEKVRFKASEMPIGLVLRWDTSQNAYTKSQ